MSKQHDSVRIQPFPATQWSLVDRARQGDDGLRRQALAVLLHRYLPALRAHLVLARRMPPDRADDLLQNFVADKIIERNLLASAAPGRGKFRTFLLATLNNYTISAHRCAAAAKRAPADRVAELGEAAAAEQVAGGADPSEQFTYAWAKETVGEAVRRMRQECDSSGRADVWRVFEARVVRPALEGVEPVAYERLVRELGLAAPLQACSLLVTGKRMFLRNLRAVAGEYADDGADGADSEIRELREILSRGGGAESPRVSRT